MLPEIYLYIYISCILDFTIAAIALSAIPALAVLGSGAPLSGINYLGSNITSSGVARSRSIQSLEMIVIVMSCDWPLFSQQRRSFVDFSLKLIFSPTIVTFYLCVVPKYYNILLLIMNYS